MNLTTTYLGLKLAHPFMVGASPLADHLDTVKRLEDGGSSALVLHSLFEEQISLAESGRIHHMDPLEKQLLMLCRDFRCPNATRFPLTSTLNISVGSRQRFTFQRTLQSWPIPANADER
jgi:hypothetical protein